MNECSLYDLCECIRAFQIPLWVSYSPVFPFKFRSASSWPHLLSLPQACVMLNNYCWLFLTIAPVEKTNFIRQTLTDEIKASLWVGFSREFPEWSKIKVFWKLCYWEFHICSVFSSGGSAAHFHCNCELLIFKSTVELERRGKNRAS